MTRGEQEQELAAALRLGEERFRAVADFTYDWETWIGPAGEVLWINPAVERITGYSVEECRGLSDYPLELVYAEDRAAMAQVLARARALESGNHHQFRVRRKDGDVRWVAISFQPIYSRDGACLGYRSSVRDIHEQKLLEAQLREAMLQAESASRAKSEFLANVSHELRTPLQSILGHAQLATAAELPPSVARHVTTLSAQAQLLLQLVNDLLDLSSLQAGVLPLCSEPYSPREVVESVVRGLEPAARAKGLELISGGAAPEGCRGDALRISQVVANLVSNAIKFTDRGQINVTLAEDAALAQLRIVVDDSGPGLPPDADLFEPFRQGRLHAERRLGGVGLGLAISRQLCEGMGGTLESGQSPAGGARLTAIIPRHAAGSAAPRIEPANAASGAPVISSDFARAHPLRILVIDDMASAREFLEAALTALGYAPQLAAAAEAGIALAREQAFDLVLVDIQMPDMDGWAAAARLRRVLGSAAFLVALTATDLAADSARLDSAGFDASARKPLALRSLQTLLERAHRHRAPPSAGESFDVERWRELRAIATGPGETLLERMAQRVLGALPEVIARVQSARENSQLVDLRRALHDLAGALLLIGARPAVEATRRCERLTAGSPDHSSGNSSDDNAAQHDDSAWAELFDHVARVQRELSALAPNPPER